MLVAPIIMAWRFFFMASMPRAASVPSRVAISAEAREINIVVQKASIMELLENRFLYHLRVNPPHCTFVLELLKESAINTAMGRYRNKNIRERYIRSAAFFTIRQHLLLRLWSP